MIHSATASAPIAEKSPTGQYAGASSLINRYRAVRRFTEHLAEPLSPEDCQVQSMVEASPVKWHLGHTTWFFETFVLGEHVNSYKPYHPRFAYLFNSYYNAAGDRITRPNRGMLTRPPLSTVLGYRRAVDDRVVRLLQELPEDKRHVVAYLITLGLHHEQQHQELIVTDVKHLLSQNPLGGVYRETEQPTETDPGEITWHAHPGGEVEIGHDGAGFACDNESPRHSRLLHRFEFASRLVTCGEYIAFIEDGGYDAPQLWLDLGWSTVGQQGWRAPQYWRQRDGRWEQFTMAGWRPVLMGEPVCHVSYFEADAYARWAGARLPDEAEWESMANDVAIEGDFAEADHLHPRTGAPDRTTVQQMFGAAWQWTRSAYSPYPGYKAPPGALGEYNGKFMCNQYVLRGGSCATPRSHIRRTYRNFFFPDARWQFSGIRLARDL